MVNYANKYNSRYDGEKKFINPETLFPTRPEMKIFPLVFHLCFELITKNFFIFRDLRLISGPFFMQYDHLTIETKWQNHWSKNNTFKAEIDEDKEKLYVLDKFPYPSGSGLHVGHPLGYTITDIIADIKDFKVLMYWSNGLGCIWATCRAIRY